MGLAFAILAAMAMGLFLVALRRRDGSHRQGLYRGWKMGLGLIPLLLCAFALAGLIQVALPPELIRTWLGEDAGLRGILIGTAAGALIAGGPYVSFPIIAGISNAGAGIGTIVALITGWAMLGVGQIPFEVGLVGPRFTMVRLATVCLTPVAAGLIAQAVFGA